MSSSSALLHPQETASHTQVSRFFCHTCSREFDSQMAESGEDGLVVCPYCKGDFCEELEHNEEGHFLLSNDGSAPEVRPSELGASRLSNSSNRTDNNSNNQDGGRQAGSRDQGLAGIGSLFSSLLGQPALSGNSNVVIQISQETGHAGGLPAALSQIFSSIMMPDPNAVSDAQFENLMDYLMRNDPNTYGNPPASEDSINKLQKVNMTSEDLALCNECTVCQEEFHEGEECIRLPCAHYFHENCVTTWLKMHNSCPTCRKEIPGSEESSSTTQQS